MCTHVGLMRGTVVTLLCHSRRITSVLIHVLSGVRQIVVLRGK